MLTGIPPTKLNDIKLSEVESYKYLGLQFTNDLKWSSHTEIVSLRAQQSLSAMLPLKHKLDRRSLETMYFSFVRPAMEYGSAFLGWLL